MPKNLGGIDEIQSHTHHSIIIIISISNSSLALFLYFFTRTLPNKFNEPGHLLTTPHSIMPDTLDLIKDFAAKAHGDQKRKYAPEPYIHHPVRVMNLCREYTQDLPLLASALLHDVLEDTPITKEELTDFLNKVMDQNQALRTISLVEELTDVYIKEKYPHWNRAKRKEKEALRLKKTSADSQTVKYADIIDNCPEIVPNDPDFAHQFLFECRSLLRQLNKGDSRLYAKAVKTVKDSITQLRMQKKGG